MAEITKWNNSDIGTGRFQKRTFGNDSSLPSEWLPEAFFYKPDGATTGRLYQNIGTKTSPIWKTVL